MSPRTLRDLYQALDWSTVDTALAQFCENQPPLAKLGQEPVDHLDFAYRFRLILLQEALYGEGEPRREARRLLQLAAVWAQVIDFMSHAGLLIPPSPVEEQVPLKRCP